ncbi:MAG: family 10 glycosylhydrolase [Bacteroidaceae bacterium]|nr:family 10 glycosylhydrolase [Bacteroidaceae bacterium]
MRRRAYLFALIALALALALSLDSCVSRKGTIQPSSSAWNAPKREFRGAWMQVVNGQYQGMTSAQQQQRLTEQLDALQDVGVNAVFFQVRPAADALYLSNYEPWSHFLTGQQGRAPDKSWDPLQFMIDACHARGMELHAWINPYRARMKGMKNSQLSTRHPFTKHPSWFIEYDGLLLFDPALQECRDYICQIVSDIVCRYDVDGVHVDDYFYPYPAGGKEFGDAKSFSLYGRGFSSRADWRRHNVDLLIEQLSNKIHRLKPWVKFGVSPFGIYHNASNDGIPGSATSGLQNYDDLYADVLLWVKKGWVDYTVPQLYWEIGNKAADYATLVKWWAENAGERPLIIGQDLERSLKYADLDKKFMLMNRLPAVQGYCWWYAEAVRQAVPAAQRASKGNQTLALQPLMPWLDKKAPGAVKNLVFLKTDDGPVLFWEAPFFKDELNRPVRYVVYRFRKGEKVNLENPQHIVGLTTNTYFSLQPEQGKTNYVFLVTALDRLQNESAAAQVKVVL